MTLPKDEHEANTQGQVYHGQTPSAHLDPPARSLGPSGLGAEPVVARSDLSYAAPRSTRRGGGTKLMLGGAALIGAVLAYIFLPKFGFGPGDRGGNPPGNGGAANPQGLVQSTQPATSPTAAPSVGVAAITPAAPLHLTIVDEIYRLGSATGEEVSLDKAVDMAQTAKPGLPVVIDLIDSSRQGAKERLRSAMEQRQVPIIWTRDGKPLSGDLSGSVPSSSSRDERDSSK